MSAPHWSRVPYVLLLAIAWGALRMSNVSVAITSIIGVVLLCLAFGAMLVEFYKSGDIGLRTFGLDTAFAVIQVIIGASVATILITRQAEFSVPDFIVFAAILADAWFSPYNSFRTALRNWAAQSGPSSPADT